MEEQIRPIQRQISVNLVRADLMKALHAEMSARIHHHRRAQYIGFQKNRRIFNRTIHMGFRREIHHDIRMFALKNFKYALPISNILPVEGEIRIFHRIAQRMDVGGVGERIHACHAPVRAYLLQKIDEIGADESGAAGHE